MLRNFFITSLRILWRNKVTSAINILSLSIGITAFILILLYVGHETSYDKFNENYENIYRIVWESSIGNNKSAATCAPMGPKFKEEFPEIVWSNVRCLDPGIENGGLGEVVYSFRIEPIA